MNLCTNSEFCMCRACIGNIRSRKRAGQSKLGKKIAVDLSKVPVQFRKYVEKIFTDGPRGP